MDTHEFLLKLYNIKFRQLNFNVFFTNFKDLKIGSHKPFKNVLVKLSKLNMSNGQLYRTYNQ